MNTVKDPNNEFYQAGVRITKSVASFWTFFVMSFPKLGKWLGIRILNPKDDQFFRTLVRDTVQARQKHKIVRNDSLDLLLQAKDGKLENDKENDAQQGTGFAVNSTDWTEDDFSCTTMC